MQQDLFIPPSIQTVIHGDCLEKMRLMADCSITHILTDPPYFLTNNSGSGFMGKSWDSVEGLSRYLWENRDFVNSAIKFFMSFLIGQNTEEEYSVLLTASMHLSEKAKSQIENALSAPQNLSLQNVQKKDSAPLLVLTKHEVLDLLKELLKNHTEIIGLFQNGVAENALFAIPITLLQNELKSIAPNHAFPKLKVNGIGEKEILLTSMDQVALKNATAAIIGTKLERLFTKEMIGGADCVQSIVKENKFSVITLSLIEMEALTNWITWLLCVINAIRESKTIQNYLINNFFKVIFLEAIRVCKPGSFLLAFSGSRTNHKLVTALEEVGWEIRDTVYWAFGSGFPKSHNHFGFDGYGTALKPAIEPCVVAMKPLDCTFKQNAEKWGVAGINIDESRVEGKRWPANLILDEEAGALLGEPARFFYCAKSSSAERNAGLEGMPKKPKGIISTENRDNTLKGVFDARDPDKQSLMANNHPTVKPIKLMEYLLKLITPPNGGLVLDPFCGSGSTLVAARNLGINAIGIELQEEYCEIARKRIES